MSDGPVSPLRRMYRSAKKTLLGRVRTHSAYQTIFSTPQGEEVLRHICKVGFVTKSTFVAGDQYETAMNEGSRRLALSILRHIYRDHDQLIKQIEKEMERQDET